MMEQKFLKLVEEKAYFAQHKRVLVALSGGLDSMTLFNLLYQNRKKLGIEILVAHVNHKQRPESDDEERILLKKMEELGVDCATSSFSGKFSEKNARDFRYDFFSKVMADKGCTALVTAHHQDDQTETIFMRLIRGSRLRHLVGMTDRQPFGAGELIRPLLNFKKSDFPATFYFEDESNQGTAYLRNRVRNLYLPQLEEENPRFSDHLRTLGAEIADLEEALAYFTKDVDMQDLQTYQAYPPSIQRVYLKNYLATFPDLSLSKEQFEEVCQILAKSGTYEHTLKNGYFLSKDYERFAISKISPRADDLSLPYLLKYGDELELGPYRFFFGQKPQGEILQEILVSCETQLLLRRRKSGDRISLNGHRKKVNRLFMDKKLSLRERNEAILLEQEGNILAIAGIVTSDLSQAQKNGIMDGKLYIQKLDR